MVTAASGVEEFGVAGFFFFQAEDGIRDLVRSRGLGDVYKRQRDGFGFRVGPAARLRPSARDHFTCALVDDDSSDPVSYTHLTLPTSDLV